MTSICVRRVLLLCLALALTLGCDGESTSDGGGVALDAGARADAGSGGDTDGGASDTDAGPTTDTDAGPGSDAGPPVPVDAGPAPSGAFIAEDGVVVVEIESAPLVSDWASETSISDFTGTAYYRWDIDTARTGSGGTGVLPYDVVLSEPGRYQFHLRSAAPMPTDDNDAFVRFPGVEVVTVRNNADAVCPDGAARERPPDADGDGWFKLYQNRSEDVWTYVSHHHDNCAHRVFVEVEVPGTYRVEISGRSRDFKLDRFVLRRVDADMGAALDPTLAESSSVP